MPSTAVKLPVDDTSSTGWSIVGGATAAAVLADESDLTYISTLVAESVVLCTVEDLPENAISVTKVEGRCRANTVTADGGTAGLYASNADEQTSSSATVTLTEVATTSAYKEIPSPSGEWSVEEFNGCSFGVLAATIEGFEDAMLVYNMDIKVTYEATAEASPVARGSGRPYYRFYLTKDVKKDKVPTKKGA